MMKSGKRSLSSRLFYTSLERVAERLNKKPLDVLHKALANAQPTIEVKSRRVGGSTYQVPIEVREGRQEALAMRWIIDSARARRGKSFDVHLSNELSDACNNTGAAVKRKEEMYRVAEANKAFAHYRW